MQAAATGPAAPAGGRADAFLQLRQEAAALSGYARQEFLAVLQLLVGMGSVSGWACWLGRARCAGLCKEGGRAMGRWLPICSGCCAVASPRVEPRSANADSNRRYPCLPCPQFNPPLQRVRAAAMSYPHFPDILAMVAAFKRLPVPPDAGSGGPGEAGQ